MCNEAHAVFQSEGRAQWRIDLIPIEDVLFLRFGLGGDRRR